MRPLSTSPVRSSTARCASNPQLTRSKSRFQRVLKAIYFHCCTRTAVVCVSGRVVLHPVQDKNNNNNNKLLASCVSASTRSPSLQQRRESAGAPAGSLPLPAPYIHRPKPCRCLRGEAAATAPAATSITKKHTQKKKNACRAAPLISPVPAPFLFRHTTPKKSGATTLFLLAAIR